MSNIIPLEQKMDDWLQQLQGIQDKLFFFERSEDLRMGTSGIQELKAPLSVVRKEIEQYYSLIVFAESIDKDDLDCITHLYTDHLIEVEQELLGSEFELIRRLAALNGLPHYDDDDLVIEINTTEVDRVVETKIHQFPQPSPQSKPGP